MSRLFEVGKVPPPIYIPPIDPFLVDEETEFQCTELAKTRLCTICNNFYHEITNIGAWKCKAHFGAFNVNGDGKNYARMTYDCCGSTVTQARGGM